MSALYPDLPLTNVPELDTFTNFLNIVASDGVLIQQYINAVNSGNTVLANQILAQIPSGSQKIIKATDLNKIQQAVLALERFFSTDIFPTIEDQQQTWLDTVNQFSYKGVWNSGTSYEVNNMVTYTTSGITFLYLATTTPPVGTLPNNTQYWRLLTVKGFDGASGAGLSYRQQWSATEVYAVNDAVTYSAALWMAIAPSQGQTPQQNSTFWKLVMVLFGTVYPIQDTPPENQPLNALWFNTSVNPTNYYSTDYFADTTLSNLTDNQNALYNIGAMSNENYIINWDFTIPIDQFGDGSYTGSSAVGNVKKCFDGYSIVYDGNGIAEKVEGGIQFTTSTIYGAFVQYVENVFPVGTALTFSVLAENVTEGMYIQINQDNENSVIIPMKSGITVANFTAVSSESITVFVAQKRGGSGSSSALLKAAKLEKGNVQTLARQTDDGWELLGHANPSVELLKCQRYLYVSKQMSVIDSKSGGFIYFNANFPTEMRLDKPTTKIFSAKWTEGVLSRWETGADMDVTATANQVYLSKKGFNGIAVGSAWSAGVPYSFYIVADARLTG